jgi:hypothetical protein
MLSPAFEAIIFLLMGLSSIWLGVYLVRSDQAIERATSRQVQLRKSLAERRLWLVAWVMMGIGWICFGITVPRYTRGQTVSVPPSAPLSDQLIWMLAFIGILGGFGVLFIWMLVHRRVCRSLTTRAHHLVEGTWPQALSPVLVGYSSAASMASAACCCMCGMTWL